MIATVGKLLGMMYDVVTGNKVFHLVKALTL